MSRFYDRLIKKYYNLRNINRISELSFEERIELSSDILSSMNKSGINLFRRILPTKRKIDDSKFEIRSNVEIINLASNDYLNLTKHPKVIERSISVSKELGIGAGSVPMLTGTSDYHKQLENRISNFLKLEDCLTYNSCYAANIGLLDALLKPGDVAIMDNLVHASIISGCQKVKHSYFLHNDIDSLKNTIKKFQDYKNKMIIIEGVYSMDGDIPPFDDIAQIARENKALLLIDEAHSIGVIGTKGRGIRFTSNNLNLESGDIVTGSFGKGLPGVGGFVAGSKNLISYLYFMSRPFLFSTAIPPNIAASVITAIDLIENETEVTAKLGQNIKQFKNGLERIGLNVNRSDSAIFPLIIRDEMKVIQATKHLQNRGIYVSPIFYPVVSKTRSRIRISVNSGLSSNDIEYCIDEIKDIKSKFL